MVLPLRRRMELVILLNGFSSGAHGSRCCGAQRAQSVVVGDVESKSWSLE